MKWRVPLLVNLEVRLVAYRAYLRDHGLSSWSRGLLGAASSAGVSKPTIGAVRLHQTWRTDGNSETTCVLDPLKES